MAEFDLYPASGLEVATWTDPSSSTKAGRIGEVAVAFHRYYRYAGPITVEVSAILNGEQEPRPDSELEGRTFKARWAEAPDGGPRIIQPGGNSAIIRFTPQAYGHYVLHVRRPAGGGVMLHVDHEREVA